MAKKADEGMQEGATGIFGYLFDRLRDRQPLTHKVGEQEYAVKEDGTLGAPVRELAPQWDAPTLEVKTLSALAELYSAQLDALPLDRVDDKPKVAFHVVDYLMVEILSLRADSFGRRHVYARAKHAPDTPFVFGKWYESPEDFLIAFRASFDFNDEAVKVCQMCSAVGAGEAVAVNDDGISQEVVIKSGTVTKSAVTLPADGIPLIPWRTFRDATPVMSKFLLRMRGVKEKLPHIALFEIDAKWKIETMASVAHYLKRTVKDATIIA
jgi:hypothetical protein